MRIVVTGASGNVGTGVLRALAVHLPSAEVIGVCRRPPTMGQLYERVRWHALDLSAPDAPAALRPVMANADAVIHLALAVQPVRDEDYLYRANVLGSQTVFDAIANVGVGQLVYASSLGVYAVGATSPVTEDWPDTGQATSTYSRHKVMVEHLLDTFEADHPEIVVSRFRPTVVVQREAAWLIRTLYLGGLVPQSALEMIRRRRLPILPVPEGMCLQFVHADDVGEAVVRLLESQRRGSFNVAADVLDASGLAELVGGRALPVRSGALRSVVTVLSAARLLALTPGWYDVAFNSPLMDTSKARRELGWAPKWSSTESARELIGGLADGAVGTSAAMGADMRPSLVRRRVGRIHDASLWSWTALAFLRAVGMRAGGPADVVVAATNIATGTPDALDRVLERRRDPVALLAPTVVGTAVVTSLRGGWTPVGATAVLHLLNMLERKRFRRRPTGTANS